MPVNRTLAKALIKRYGQKRGEDVYYGLEADKNKAFKKGLKTATKEKHILKHFPKKK